MRVFVTGMGINSPIGNDLEETYENLVGMKSGLKRIEFLKSINNKQFIVGEVSMRNSDFEAIFKLKENDQPRTTLLALSAANQALSMAGLGEQKSRPIALVSASTVGGMCKSEIYYKDFLDKKETAKFFDTHDNGQHCEYLANYFKFNGFFSTVNSACSSSANALILASKLIQNGMYDCVVAGGADSLTMYTLLGFDSLLLIDKDICKPFDKDRKGINLGEGSAYMVLESERSVNRSKKKVYAEFTGFANVNDAYHETSSSPEGKGIFKAMSKCIEKAKLNISDISYVNVHGTGTKNNDLTEGAAVRGLFGDAVPPFSSTKSYTGHTLAASGIIEAVISVLAINRQTIFPNLNFESPLPEHGLIPVVKPVYHKVSHVLSNSIGIGGFCSAILMSNV